MVYDVRNHSTELGTAAIHRKNCAMVKRRRLKLVPAIANEAPQIHQRLHRSFAEGRFADYDTAAIILNRSGKNLRRGGTVSSTALPAALHIRFQDPDLFYFDITIGVLYLNHRATGNKQTGQLGCF